MHHSMRVLDASDSVRSWSCLIWSAQAALMRFLKRCYINEHLGNEYSLRLVELQSTGWQVESVDVLKVLPEKKNQKPSDEPKIHQPYFYSAQSVCFSLSLTLYPSLSLSLSLSFSLSLSLSLPLHSLPYYPSLSLLLCLFLTFSLSPYPSLHSLSLILSLSSLSQPLSISLSLYLSLSLSVSLCHFLPLLIVFHLFSLSSPFFPPLA